MTISSDLLLAILSMDAYNRGYDPGLVMPNGTQIGSAVIGRDPTLLLRDPVTDQLLDKPAGFYAIAYTLADKSTVISYRGTDALPSVRTLLTVQAWADGFWAVSEAVG